jgi:hypothetical protein
MASDTQDKPDNSKTWARIETISRTLAVVAIPIVIAVVGALVQSELQRQSVSKDYVQLAVSILREPDQKKVSPELREWAVDLLNEHSTVKLNDKFAQQLKKGESILPPLETFKAASSSTLSAEDDARVNAVLKTFQEYLRNAGFNIPPSGDITYDIVAGANEIKIDGLSYYSYFDFPNNTLRVAEKQLRNDDFIRHEYMRHVVSPIYPPPRDPYSDQRWWDYQAISSGLAVYFPCSFDSDPVFGTRDLGIDLSKAFEFDRHANDQSSADDVGRSIWGRALWELRGRIGRSAADKLLASTWVSWQPTDPGSDLFVQFARKVLEVDTAQGGQHSAIIQDIFKRHGLAV